MIGGQSFETSVGINIRVFYEKRPAEGDGRNEPRTEASIEITGILFEDGRGFALDLDGLRHHIIEKNAESFIEEAREYER